MLRKASVLFIPMLLLASCAEPQLTDVGAPEADAAALFAAGQGLVRKAIPAEDPGPPFYARVSPITNQLHQTDGWLAVPFYRSPECIPADFNLLELFHIPGTTGPGAFGCPLLTSGFLLIEPDAPLGTFPRQVVLTGGGVQFWFVRWVDFQEAMKDGVVTIAELEALHPLKGTASNFHETLRPRDGEHLVAITARGMLEDGRSFQFQVNQPEYVTKSIRIRFR
ncbi:hypothetical protein BH23GEM3_BH23GEM3_12620 [soil metagenome]|nr:hypothetical protein [Gemmatimonadota bacterium]